MSTKNRNTIRQNSNKGITPNQWIMISIGLVLVGISIWLITDCQNLRSSTQCSKSEHNTVSTDIHTNSSGQVESHSPLSINLSVALPDGIPSEIIEYEGFTVNFNKENHTPNYCAWNLTNNETTGDISRSNKFKTDINVSGCPSSADYTHSGYDRGHIVPANDQKWSQKAMEDCFYMTNICPQSHDLNNGAWKTLETKEQQWARRDGNLLIIAGPIYTENDQKRIGKSAVRVPSSFFKVLVAPDVESPRGIAFIYPNQLCQGNMRDYTCTIDRLEEITGYDFFPGLPNETERQIESVANFTEWDKRK